MVKQTEKRETVVDRDELAVLWIGTVSECITLIIECAIESMFCCGGINVAQKILNDMNVN